MVFIGIGPNNQNGYCVHYNYNDPDCNGLAPRPRRLPRHPIPERLHLGASRGREISASRDRLAAHILVFEGDSHVEWFEGNFQDYEDDKKRRLSEDSAMPKHIKYKQFTR